MKKRVQSRFARAFEVIITKSEFGIATYCIGDFTCRVFRNGYYILAYETPHQSGVGFASLQLKVCLQYHPYNKEEELEYGSISDPDPLGTPLFELPGQIRLDTGVELESDGYRLGFPKGTHCDPIDIDGEGRDIVEDVDDDGSGGSGGKDGKDGQSGDGGNRYREGGENKTYSEGITRKRAVNQGRLLKWGEKQFIYFCKDTFSGEAG